MITLNEKALEKIDKKFTAMKMEDRKYKTGLGIDVREAIHGATVYAMNGQQIVCELEDLGQTIYELTMLRTAIEDATGIVL